MKRILIPIITFATLICAVGAIGACPRYLEELRIGGGLGDTADGGADFDKQGNIATDGWISANQQFRVHGTPLAAQHLSDGAVVGMLNENENVTGAWSFSAPISNTYDTNGAGYTQVAREMVVGTNYTDGRYCAQQDVALRAGKGGGSHSVMTQPSGSGATCLNELEGTGGVFFGNGAGAHVGSVDAAGAASFDGTVKAKGGRVEAGVDATTRGVLSASSGSGGAAPGCVRLASANGSVWYVFVRDDGTLKIHNALPTQNSNGVVIGTQY